MNFRGVKGDLNDKLDFGVANISGVEMETTRPSYKMQGTTEFKESYPGHQPVAAEPLKRHTAAPQGKMENRTSYNIEFVPHELEPERDFGGIMAPEAGAQALRKSPYRETFASEYRELYRGEPLSTNDPLQPLPVLAKPKFDAKSTH